jgi:hypothetical protein
MLSQTLSTQSQLPSQWRDGGGVNRLQKQKLRGLAGPFKIFFTPHLLLQFRDRQTLNLIKFSVRAVVVYVVYVDCRAAERFGDIMSRVRE